MKYLVLMVSMAALFALLVGLPLLLWPSEVLHRLGAVRPVLAGLIGLCALLSWPVAAMLECWNARRTRGQDAA